MLLSPIYQLVIPVNQIIGRPTVGRIVRRLFDHRSTSHFLKKLTVFFTVVGYKFLRTEFQYLCQVQKEDTDMHAVKSRAAKKLLMIFISFSCKKQCTAQFRFLWNPTSRIVLLLDKIPVVSQCTEQAYI